ncbi:MAG: SH3 domain-containing protein [Paracoccus sp. (in: a-proteobacteria)]|uniref:SH3 domain-containing protein n=1 Tax=Paracoccus sp. TaxID=267 RepID=UPI00391C64F0
MLKLSGLMLATLAGLFALLTIYGRDDLRSQRRPAAPLATVPQDASADTPVLADPLLADIPAPEPEHDDAAPLPTPQQTAEQAPRFPGPALQASPEFAGRAPADPAGPTGPTGPSDATAPASGAQLWVTASRLNMRSGPDSGAPVVTGLDGGTALEALGPTDAAWVHVRAPGGQTGYVSGQFLSDQPQ